MKTYRFEIKTEDERIGVIIEVKVKHPLNREDALQKAIKVTKLHRDLLKYRK